MSVSSRNASFHDGVLVSVLWSPFKLAFAMVLGAVAVLVLAWSIDELFVFKVWPQGIDRLRCILRDDLSSGIAFARRQGDSARAITGAANVLYAVIFETSGVDDMGRHFADSLPLSIPDTVLRRAYVAHREAIEVSMLGTQLVGIRIAILTQFIPLLLALYAVGASDGLSERLIRTACGGCESANLYHRAKYLQIAVLGLGALLVLCWPGEIAWGRSAAALALAICALARMQWTYYKKHV